MIHSYFLRQLAQMILNYDLDRSKKKMSTKQFLTEINKIITNYITHFTD